MLVSIKSILLENQELQFPGGTPRRLNIQPSSGKATVIVGAKGCGKTTYLFQLIQGLLNSGVLRENIVYLNFADERLRSLKPNSHSLVAEAYFSLYPHKKNTEKVYFFFDEIQVVKGWEAMVDKLLLAEVCEVFLAGSSANLLINNLPTESRVRGSAYELFPFSFPEFLDHRGLKSEEPLATIDEYLIKHAWDKYPLLGGFPDSIDLEWGPLTRELRQKALRATVLGDIVERHDVSHPQAVLDLARTTLKSPTASYSVNKLTAYLKSLGHKVPKAVVADYLDWFEDAYFLFSLRLFDPQGRNVSASPKQIFPIDPALTLSLSPGPVDQAPLLKNLVFLALRRGYQNIHYYRTQSLKEVDFIVIRPGLDPLLVAFWPSLSSLKDQKRNLMAIIEALDELNLKAALVVSRDETDRITVNNRVITALPIWRFLLLSPDQLNEVLKGRSGIV
ncbi:MAG: ATP-binding protein [Deltaproteobacteria bacterium]|jgi:predicted AAA+ superfamily ATPase|nr:ATP-binding protein [Deltaproteobacteria bacterium]